MYYVANGTIDSCLCCLVRVNEKEREACIFSRGDRQPRSRRTDSSVFRTRYTVNGNRANMDGRTDTCRLTEECIRGWNCQIEDVTQPQVKSFWGKKKEKKRDLVCGLAQAKKGKKYSDSIPDVPPSNKKLIALANTKYILIADLWKQLSFLFGAILTEH